MSLSGVTLAFDLDGTLVDTAPDLIGVLNHMLGEHDLPQVPLDAARHLVGHGAAVMLAHGFAEAGAAWDEARAPALLDRFIELYLDRIARESRPFPGAETALDRLAAEGARLCVCTNKRTDLSIALLDALNLGGRFAAIVGPDSVTRRKPDRAHLLEAIAMAGGDPGRAVMIGDSATDTATARAADVPSVVVSFGYTEIPAHQLGGDVLIDRFDELPVAIRTVLGL